MSKNGSKQKKLKNNCKRVIEKQVFQVPISSTNSLHNLSKNGFGYIILVSNEQVSVSTQSQQ